MSRPVSGAVKTYLVRVKKENGIIYVYERKRRYDPEVGYTRTFDSHLLGKIMPGTDEIVSTRPRRNLRRTQAKISLLQLKRSLGDMLASPTFSRGSERKAALMMTSVAVWMRGERKKSSLLPVTSRPIPIKPCRACQNGNARILHLVQRN